MNNNNTEEKIVDVKKDLNEAIFNVRTDMNNAVRDVRLDLVDVKHHIVNLHAEVYSR